MRLFDRIKAKKLGVTRESVERILTEIDKVTPVDQTASDVLAMEVMRQLREANADAWCNADEAGFDWDAFLEFVTALVEMLIPLIVKKRTPA